MKLVDASVRGVDQGAGSAGVVGDTVVFDAFGIVPIAVVARLRGGLGERRIQVGYRRSRGIFGLRLIVGIPCQ